MPATSPCNPCCSKPLNTNIPGIEGVAGIDGTNGINAYTVTTADFVVPAVGDTVTVQVEDSSWMVVGQVIFIAGPSYWRVVSIPDSTSVELEFLGYTGDVSPGATISTGAGVSPGGVASALSSLSVHAAGTAYSLTNVAALLDFGTTDSTLVITAPGTWLILTRVRYDYNAATFAAVRTVTTALRRTNNTAADVISSAWKTDIITTLTYTAHFQVLPPVLYTTANSDDILQLWASVNTVPSAGSLDAVEAEIVCVKIS